MIRPGAALAAAMIAALSLMIPQGDAAATGAPASTAATAPAAAPGAITGGWSLLKEGVAEGTIEADAKNPSNPDPHILRIAVTKYASEPGTGRMGAKNSNTIAVKEGQNYEVTFTGISEGIGVGLVFSLENEQGQVLARTTLPEIGRGGGGGGRGRGREAQAGAADAAASQPGGAATVAAGNWRHYLVSLHVRTSDPAAHLVITPIEAVPVWLDGITINERR
jgi:hypothetical protein